MDYFMVLNVAQVKVKMINVRLSPAVHDQFKIACDLRGVSMSGLLHQFIVRTIREERELEPKAFEVQPQPQGRRMIKANVGNKIEEKKKATK